MSITASTFARVTSVIVDPAFTQTDIGRYPDPLLLSGGADNSAIVPASGPAGLTAQVGQLWRGMPIYLNNATGKLVPPNTSASTTSAYVGVLADDLTTFVLARGTKVGFVKKGRVRSYAGASLKVGDPVKPDTGASNSGAFAGFIKWIDGTDSVQLRVGYAYPLDDGSASNGSTAASTMAQGDVIFVDLI